MAKRICICGLKGSGKSIIAQALCEKNPMLKYVEISRLIRAKMKIDGVDPDKIYEYSLQLRRQYGADVVSKMALVEIAGYSGAVIIDSLRTEQDFDVFNENGQASIIAVHSSPRLRYSRIMSRRRSTDPITLEGLSNMDRKSMEMGAERLFTLSNYAVINDGTVEQAMIQANQALTAALKEMVS